MTNYNFKGVTSAMLETDCGPEHMNEESGDTHGNIYDINLDKGNIDEDGDDIGVFTLATNTTDLDFSYGKTLMLVVTALMMIPKTTQTRVIMMKRTLTPLDLKTFI